jgi:hypothetical protein
MLTLVQKFRIGLTLLISTNEKENEIYQTVEKYNYHQHRH